MAPASAFAGILKGQYWPPNLAILLLTRGSIAHTVDAGLTEMVEFEKCGLP